jgi:hypothetical protein
MAAGAELGALVHADEARAWFYATARTECYRHERTAASLDSQVRGAPRNHKLGRRGRHRDEGVQLPSAGENFVLTHANLTGFLSQEHEAIELTNRHDLSEAELAAVLHIPGPEAQALAARARDQLLPLGPSLDTLPPVLRERILRSAAVSVDPASDERAARRARSTRPTGFQRLGQMAAWSRIRANPGVAAALTAVAVWAVAATSATLVTLTGTHSKALTTQTRRAPSAAVSPPPGGTVAPTATASPSQSPAPASSSVTGRITTIPSPAQSARPTPSHSTTPAPSASPSASASPSLTPSPSPSASPSASPTGPP